MFGLGKKASTPQQTVDEGFEIITMKEDLANPQKYTQQAEVQSPMPIDATVSIEESPFLKEHAPEPVSSPPAAEPVPQPTTGPQPTGNPTPMLEQIMASHDFALETPKVAERQTPPAAPAGPTAAPIQSHNPYTKVAPPSASPLSEKIQQQSNGYNKILLFSAVFVFILTIGGGAYYYFYIMKPESEPTTGNNLPLDNTSTPPPDAPPVEEATLPDALSAVDSIMVTSSDAKAAIKSKIAELKLQGKTSQGHFYQLINASSTTLTAQEINKMMQLNHKEIESYLKAGWLYIAYNDAMVGKTGLVYEVTSKESVSSSILASENQLPTRLAGMFIDEPMPASQKIAFSQGNIDSRVRYFNFTPGDHSISIDWALLTIKGKQFLLFASSRETMLMMVADLEASSN